MQPEASCSQAQNFFMVFSIDFCRRSFAIKKNGLFAKNLLSFGYYIAIIYANSKI